MYSIISLKGQGHQNCVHTDAVNAHRRDQVRSVFLLAEVGRPLLWSALVHSPLPSGPPKLQRTRGLVKIADQRQRTTEMELPLFRIFWPNLSNVSKRRNDQTMGGQQNSELHDSQLRNSQLRNSQLRNSQLRHAVDYSENSSSGIAELPTSSSGLQ